MLPKKSHRRRKKIFPRFIQIEGEKGPETVRAWCAEYIYDLREMLRCKSVSIPVVLTILLGYGFMLLHPSVSVDDTAIGWYIDDGQILLQGRFFPYFIQRVLPVYRFQPVVTDLLAVLSMTAGFLLFSCVLNRAAERALPLPSRTAFVCLALSYPLIAEIFIYMQVSFTIGLGYLLTSAAAAALFGYWQSGKGRFLAITAVLSCLLAGSFESFLAVLICEAVMLLILREIYGPAEEHPIKRFVLRMLSCAGAIAAGLILKAGVMGIIRITHQQLFSSGTNPSQNTILWGSDCFTAVFSEMFRLIAIKYLLHALSYLPISLYALCFFGCILAAIFSTAAKRGTLALQLFSLALSTQALSFIQGDAQRYRTCQCFAVFIAFFFLLAGNLICQKINRKWVRPLAGTLAALLCLVQAQNLNHWFSLDFARWQFEQNHLTGAAQEVIRDYGDEKPVIFTGAVSLPAYLAERFSVPDGGIEARVAEKIYAAMGEEYVRPWLTETLQNSVITWAISALDGAGGQLRILLSWEGYDFPAYTQAQYQEAETRAAGLPAYPAEGSILDCGEYILVHMG